jgi:hypothetical protein
MPDQPQTQQQAHQISEAAITAAAVVSTNIEYIKGDIADIKQAIKELSGAYPTKAEFAALGLKVDDHERRTRTLEQNMWKWVGIASVLSPLLLSGLGQVIKLID